MTKQIDIDHLANLSKLTISDQEKKKLEKQLESTIDYIQVLGELNTKNIEPSFQVTGQTNISRKKDESKKDLSQKQALTNAPRKKSGYFVVKKIKWEN